MAERADSVLFTKFDGVPGEDYIVRFLKSKVYSPKLVRNFSNQLEHFFTFTEKHPLDVTLDDWDAYAAQLNARPLGYDTKRVFRANLHSFFEDVRYYAKRKERIDFINPIPDLAHAGLEEGVPKKMERKFLTDDQLKDILLAARRHRFSLYVMLLLLVHCGMRIKELLTIKRADLHLEERWFETGMERGARKSNKHGKRHIVFCFPASVQVTLKQYLLTAPASEWLFPNRVNTSYYRSLVGILERLSETTGIAFTSHWFRKTLNTNRKYKMKCPQEIRQKLINHISREVIEEHYDEADPTTLRAEYDRYHPYSEF